MEKVSYGGLGIKITTDNQKLDKILQSYGRYVNVKYNVNNIEKEIAEIIKICNYNGYLDAEIIPQKIYEDGKNKSVVVELQLKSGRRYKFYSIKFEGKNIPIHIFAKLLNFHKGEYFSERKIKNYLQYLAGYEFVDKAKILGFKKLLNQYAYMIVEVNMHRTVKINGVLGYKDKLYGVGNLNLLNPIGLGQKIYFNINYSEYSHKLRFAYENDYIFSPFVNMNLAFIQSEKQDEFSKFDIDFLLLYNFYNRIKLGEGIKIRYKTSYSDSIRFINKEKFMLTTISINYLINTKIKQKYIFSLNFISNILENKYYLTINLQNNFFYNRLFYNLVWDYRGNYSKELDTSDEYFYGGAITLRGYKEDVFSDYNLVGMRNELGYKIGDIDFFIHDDCYFSWKNGIKNGIGIGLTIESNNFRHSFSISFPNEFIYKLAILHYSFEGGF